MTVGAGLGRLGRGVNRRVLGAAWAHGLPGATAALLVGAAQFVLYGLGMGSVSPCSRWPSPSSTRRWCGGHAGSRLVRPSSALLLLLAGGFIVYCWLTLGELLGRP